VHFQRFTTFHSRLLPDRCAYGYQKFTAHTGDGTPVSEFLDVDYYRRLLPGA
jgi:hypothetical protein